MNCKTDYPDGYYVVKLGDYYLQNWVQAGPTWRDRLSSGWGPRKQARWFHSSSAARKQANVYPNGKVFHVMWREKVYSKVHSVSG